MLKLALNLVLPAVGIVLAALVQLAFTTLWPGIQVVPSLVVSVDSYFVVLLTVGLCFVAGAWAQTAPPHIPSCKSFRKREHRDFIEVVRYRRPHA